MHDIDRATFETNEGYEDTLELEAFEYGDGYGNESSFQQFGSQRNGSGSPSSLEWAVDGPFDEATEMDLAAELLSAEDDEELEQFLGKLVKRAVRGVRRFAQSDVGRLLTEKAKGLARRALPIAGRAIGTFVGGPAGGAIGERIGNFGVQAFKLELEGMSPEDQEFEVARRVVRFVGDAAQEAATNGSGVSSETADAVVNRALKTAAQKHAPGLLRATSNNGSSSRRNAGRWVRRGGSIVLLGVS